MKEIKEISTMEELKEVIKEAQEKPVIIFKHSSTCPISARGKREVDSYAKQCHEGDPQIYQVTVQSARSLSNEIAESLQVEHQSPQIIMLNKGKACWDCSHGRITVESIKEAVEKLD